MMRGDMETWFFNHVLVLLLLVGLPGPLGAGTPGNNSTEPVTVGLFSPGSERSSTVENNETTTSSSSESLSPSQRNILLTDPDTDQTQTFTETSSRPLEASRSVSFEPLSSTLTEATTEASTSTSKSTSTDWNDFFITDPVPHGSPAVSPEARSWMDRLLQDSADTTLRLGDTSALSSQTAVHTVSTYTSTTFSRAGERTLLSVTSSSSNSTSSALTDDSNSHQPPSTLVVSSRTTETEDYTHSAPSTRTDSDTTNQNMTNSFRGMFSETGSPGGDGGTQSLYSQPNATQYQHNSTISETSDSTPPLRGTEPSTDRSEESISSTPPVTFPTNTSGTDQDSGSSLGTSTESSTEAHSSSTQNQEHTDNGVSTQTREHSIDLGLTTAPPTVSSSAATTDNSLTVTSVLLTEVALTSTPVTITEKSQITEEDTIKATVSTTPTTTSTTIITTPPLPSTSSTGFRSTTGSSTPPAPTEAIIPFNTPSTTASTLAPQTSAAHSTPPVSPSQTQGPSTGVVNPTYPTTLQIDTSTPTVAITIAHHQYVTTAYTHGIPTKTTQVLLTTRTTSTAPSPTTSLTGFTPSKTPKPTGNPCETNPCMNGGMCMNFRGNQFTCLCQKEWTGQTCNYDVDECEAYPCPAGSRCVNTRGSFSCECPLGYNLEDGRTCTRAKTFLGTFTVNRKPHDPISFKDATVHEIQREIIHLLNASLSPLHGYSRSTVSRKGEDGVRLSAVNMFSISTDVTSAEVYNRIQMSLSNCSSSLSHCRMILHHQLTYQVESLCVAQKTQCDSERSTCTDSSGTANCQCLQGYYKHNPEDLSCLECGDGYKLENNTCVPCMFGFGGFNCGNFYKLIAVVVSPAGGGLLLILIIALIVTCCKRDKNDINKIIFKSGDLQMSPYADFPKSNRISMEWGRETIEMQENGSTKNLLQMTDIYYSPALRNADLDRNGLYPFTGLPGSRHSCIYPAQWNPSFISDDSRRRDYF